MSLLRSCPVCQSTDWEPVGADLSGPGVTSDWRPAPAGVQNVLCRRCGLVANAAGPRGHTTEFYREAYDLLGEQPGSEPLLFRNDEAVGINDPRFEFLMQAGPFQRRGRILEIGAGKGLFLRRWIAHFPEWNACAVEPSQSALKHLRTMVPRAQVFDGPFESSPFWRGPFDLVVALDVLEHVVNPRTFLAEVRKSLGPNGLLFLEVPNFLTNPSDLLCADHLTRFEPETLTSLLRVSGLDVVAVAAPPDRVPMWCLAARGADGAPEIREISRVRQILGGHIQFVHETFASYRECAIDARARRGRMALFGLGIIGLAGILRGHVAKEDLTALLDDNRGLWGSHRLGIPVDGIHSVGERGISHVALAANPCYLYRMVARLRPLPVKLVVPGPA